MRYLTKSRFAVALECPTKLRFIDDPEFNNTDLTNEFLLSLADGGHQVGALAKTLFPGGIEVDEEGHDAQVARTSALLTSDATLFEAAFSVGSLFARADVLVKSGKQLSLYEVKAKSIDPSKAKFLTSKGKVASDFKDKLYDVAFQRNLLRKNFPDHEIQSNLILVNKTAICDEDGLPQRLTLKREAGRIHVEADASLGNGRLARLLLYTVPVDGFLDRLEKEPLELGGYRFSFQDGIEALASSVNGTPFKPLLGSWCKRCQFVASSPPDQKRNGREICFRELLNIPNDTRIPTTVIELHSNRNIDRLIQQGKRLLTEIEQTDIAFNEDASSISSSHRQWLQVLEAGGERRPTVRSTELKELLGRLRYPVHFVDFETARPTLPYSSGRRPYELIFFQFSRHVLTADGRLQHASQHITALADFNTSVRTLRELQKELSNDDGSILHWYDYERTVLNELRKQIGATPSGIIHDKEALISFIDGVLPRLVDIGRAFESLVFLPGTSGSSSIKAVLPSVLDLAVNATERFASPIYGSANNYTSLNFRNQIWVMRNEQGDCPDPYSLLGERLDDPNLAGLERLETSQDAIKTGGAAMVAFAMLQTPISDAERTRIVGQLYRYCELDTLAMYLALEGIRGSV